MLFKTPFAHSPPLPPNMKYTSSYLHRDISAKKTRNQKKKINKKQNKLWTSSVSEMKKTVKYSRSFRENRPLTAAYKAIGDILKISRLCCGSHSTTDYLWNSLSNSDSFTRMWMTLFFREISKSPLLLLITVHFTVISKPLNKSNEFRPSGSRHSERTTPKNQQHSAKMFTED